MAGRTANRTRRTAERNVPPNTLFLHAGAISLAEIQAADGESVALPTCQGTAYTGGLLRQGFSSFPIVIDLETLKTNAQIPLLKQHDPEQIVGHAAPEISAQRVRIKDGVISGVSDAAKEVVAVGKNKFPWQLSVGANRGVKGRYEFVEKGDAAKVNGRNWSGPLYVARDMELVEVSFVPIGADTKTSATIAAALYREELSVKTFAQWLEENECDSEDKLKPRMAKILRAQYDAEIAALASNDETEGDDDEETAPPPKKRGTAFIKANGDDGASMGRDLASELKAAYRNTSRRLARIDGLRAKYKTDDLKLQAELDGMIEAAIDDDQTSLDKLELNLIHKHRPAALKANGGRTRIDDFQAEVIACALAITAGMPEAHVARGMSKDRAEEVMNRAMSEDFRGYSLHDLCADVIRAAGREYRGAHGGLGMLSMAREASQQLRAEGASMFSLPYVLGTIANKSMLPKFEGVEVAWPKLATVKSVNDFKQNTTIRFLMGADGLKKVGRDGKLQNLTLGDSAFTYSLATRGGILGITRTDYVNDDLSVFSEVPGLMGELFATSIEEEFFNSYINRNDFVTSGTNQNYMEGSATALDIAALKSAYTYWGNKVINGRPITAAPKYIVCGIPLKVTADEIYKNATIQPAATKNTNLQFPNNPYVGLLEVVASPYLSNTALRLQETGAAMSGQSDTQWFLQADPNKLPSQIVGFLNGRRTPYLEVQGVGSWDAEFDVLGCQMRIFGDFGVGYAESYGIFKSKGAA